MTGKVVGVLEENIHHLINQAYHAGGPYQWAREGAVNSIQAEATWIHFGIERQGFESMGVARRYIADNGLGMSPDDLKLFMSTFGGGGRSIGMGENFGQGFKASCYEWNPYGIIVASWTKDYPDGQMIWINRVERGGNIYWELKEFEFETNEGPDWADCVQPYFDEEIGVDFAKLKSPEIEEAGHGTVFLFLGDDKTRDTVHGDYLAGEDAMFGILAYLNSRFIDLPEHVDMWVDSLYPNADADKSGKRFLTDANGRSVPYHSMQVRGVRGWIGQKGTPDKSGPKALTGTLRAEHNTEIRWYLTEENDTSTGRYRPRKPMIMVAYEDEAYEIRDDWRVYRRFGVTDEVRNRLWLVITPPKLIQGSTAWGVTPQASRGRLICKGGTDLPWEDWFDLFYREMPEPVRRAIEESRSTDSAGDAEGRRERLKRIQAKFGSRWRPVTLVESSQGRFPGNEVAGSGSPQHTGGPRSGSSPVPTSRPRPASGSNGPKPVLEEDESGEKVGKVARRSEGIPEVEWSLDAKGDDAHYAAWYQEKYNMNGAAGLVTMNSAWPMFEQEIRFWQEEYPRATIEEVTDLVRTAYEDEVVSKIMHANKLRNSQVGVDENGEPMRLGSREIEKLTEPAALTAGVIGLTNVETKIRTAAGSRFGPAVSSRANKR